jgi:molybdate transport system substrate-binding protein
VCALLFALALTILACSANDDDGDGNGEVMPSADGSTDVDGDLTIFAASSLTDAFGRIGEILEEENPDLDIEFNFAASSALRTQIAEGAPADVYASADDVQMQMAAEEGLIEGEPELLVRNTPVIVVPADNPADITTPMELANDGVKLVLAAENVPIGRYAREILVNLEQDPDYGADYSEDVLANVVSNETDVRAVLVKVELGEADAGVVYTTDALIAGDAVLTIELPEDANVLAEYFIAPVADGSVESALAFIAFVLSEEGQAVLREFGFQTGR